MMSKHKSNKIDPPLERRMVVGETSSDVPTGPSNRSRDEGFEEEKSRRIHGTVHKDKDTASVRYDRDRKKALYDRNRRKVE